MRTFYATPTVIDKLEQSQYAMTLEEIGDLEGVSRERIRQIEKSALDKLRRRCLPQLMVMRELALEMRRNAGNGEYGVVA